MAVMIAGAAIAAVGMITNYLGSKKKAKAAKKAAANEAWAEGRTTAERIRQLNIQERTMKGETMAMAAGSGVLATEGSPLQVMAEQAQEFKRERMFTKEVGATKAAASRQRGRDVAQEIQYQSYSNMAQSASNVFSMMGASGRFG